MNLSLKQHESALWILREALGMESGDSLLILCDEFTDDVADCILVTGKEELRLDVIKHCVMCVEQESYLTTDRKSVPSRIRSLIDEVTHVIVIQRMTLLNHHFRLSILEYCSGNHNLKVASMPGVLLQNLDLCHGNLDTITKRCKLIADLMVRCNQARLTSYTLAGKPMELVMEIGQFHPIHSTGRIESGGWGNVPSGETFLVPNPGTANGTIVINGSIFQYPIPKDEELVIQFVNDEAQFPPLQNGRISEYSSKILFDKKGKEIRANCSKLCELGVGTNDTINRFTGAPIFDEKILGSAHIGLGRNRQFGGPVDCESHHDFVAKNLKLELGDVVVIDDGKFVLEEKNVYPNWRDILGHALEESRKFQLGPNVSEENHNEVFLSWHSPRGATMFATRVGDPETSRIAKNILLILKRSAEPITGLEVSESLCGQCDSDAVPRTLGLLMSFGLVEPL